MLYRLGLASEPSTRARTRTRTPSHSVPKRKSHSWLGLSDLVPTQGTVSTTIESGGETSSGTRLSRTRLSLRSVVLDAQSPGFGGITQCVAEQEVEGPPRLQLRDSLRHSLMRGSGYAVGGGA